MTDYAYRILQDRLAAENAQYEELEQKLAPVIEQGREAEETLLGQRRIVEEIHRAMEIIGPKATEEIVSDFRRSYGSSTSGLVARGLREDHER